MQHIKTLLLLPLALVCAHALPAQSEDLTRDQIFFDQQKQQYQRWLDHNGMGKTLQARDLRVEPQRVSLFLAFPSENADTVSAAWTQLKKDYAAQNTGLSLEQALFYKMLHLFELQPPNAAVVLYDTYDTARDPCFYRAVFVQDESLHVDSSGCQSKKLDIYVSPSDLGGTKKTSVAAFQRQFSQTVVFDKIHRYAKKRYEQKTCEGRYPAVSAPFIDGNVMRFEVTDLCKQVLKDAQNNTLCAFLNKYIKPCNWIKREKLGFTFSYQTKDNGFQLKCEVEGKVGSGYYPEVGRGGYLDMEIDFDGYLKDYAEKLQYELKQAILEK